MIKELTETDTLQPGDFVRFDFGDREGAWDVDVAMGCFPAETVAERRARYPKLGECMKWGRKVEACEVVA